MRAAADFQTIACPDRSGAWTLACWDEYDADSKVQLHASALLLADGRTLFVDPIALGDAALSRLLAPGVRPHAILLTNGNHTRQAREFRERFQVPICARAPAATAAALSVDETIPEIAGPVCAGALEAIPLPGAAAGEVAFYRPDGGGLVSVGDALINLPSHPFTFLPAKYCEDPGALRQSLTCLLDRPFATLTFAHGSPLVMNPQRDLAALLSVNPDASA